MDSKEEKEIYWNRIILAILRLAELNDYDLKGTTFMFSPDVIFEKIKVKDLEVTHDNNGDEVFEVPVAQSVLFNQDMFDSIKEIFNMDPNTMAKPIYQENNEVYKFAETLHKKIGTY